MAYRYIEHKVEPRHRDTETLSSPCKIYLQNGSISDTAYPCWYLIEPRPKRLEFYTDGREHKDIYNQVHHIDKSKKKFIDETFFAPIHLSKEGYTSLSVNTRKMPAGVTMSASIDDDKDWIVRVKVSADITDNEINKKKNIFEFTIIANGTINNKQAKDTIMNGLVIIEPGPIGNQSEVF